MIEKIGIIGGTGKMGSSFKKKFEKHVCLLEKIITLLFIQFTLKLN